MKRTIGSLLVCAILALSCLAQTARAEEKKETAEKPLIQMAILLDTSGSMSGLINQARTELWKVVNEFATTKKNGQIPRLEVALYEYGHSPLGGNQIRKILSLTTDLDKVSEKLFALTTSGGNEYCGMVIKKATDELKWSQSNGDLKVVFIAGNEPFTQGPVDYKAACKAAISKGIIVNTIHCGSEQAGISGKWKDGAVLADGSYMCINQNRTVAHIKAPQDKKIAKLGDKLNDTYIPYGAKGKLAAERQRKQDTNAKKAAPAANVQRMVTKANAQYVNTSWDLVDALKNDKIKLEEIDEKSLPEKMQKMTLKERKAHIEENTRRRAEIRKKINELNAARKKYVAEKRKEMGKSGDDTLGEAMSSALQEQAAKKGFKN
ncbi:MAG: VWA domain-containing protein [Planctomycetes bacterium]|nr:VWA domain-containing protein [Planctomycetota bacterium]